MPPARGLPSPAGVDAFPIGKEGAGKEEASSGGQDLSALEPEGHLDSSLLLLDLTEDDAFLADALTLCTGDRCDGSGPHTPGTLTNDDLHADDAFMDAALAFCSHSRSLPSTPQLKVETNAPNPGILVLS